MSMSKECEVLTSISKNLKSGYAEIFKEWTDSPFEWIKGGLSSRSKGAVGEQLVAQFLGHYGFDITDTEGTDSDIGVNGAKVEIKLSTEWQEGHYRFQQIRDQDYDILFCLGLSPFSAYAWVAGKQNIVFDEIAHQHDGSRGRDTWWITAAPKSISHTWLNPQNGDLSLVCDELIILLN